MKRVFFLFVLLSALFLNAENLEIETVLYRAPSLREQQKTLNVLLEGKETKKLFTAKVLCFTGVESSCTLSNNFQYQRTGFTIKLTPAVPKQQKKNYPIKYSIDWTFTEHGPFLASAKESFYEGTLINSLRNLQPELFSPLGITQSKNTNAVYIPAIRFSRREKKPEQIFRRGGKWEILLRITEDGKPPEEIKTIPIYHRGKFPATNPPGINCRMFNFRGITVMNMYYCHQRGIRKDGIPVFEEMDLSLCFLAPGRGKTVKLADLISHCYGENTAFGKSPEQGGRPIRYELFLTVK